MLIYFKTPEITKKIYETLRDFYAGKETEYIGDFFFADLKKLSEGGIQIFCSIEYNMENKEDGIDVRIDFWEHGNIKYFENAEKIYKMLKIIKSMKKIKSEEEIENYIKKLEVVYVY